MSFQVWPPGKVTIKIELKYSNGEKQTFLLESDILKFDISQPFIQKPYYQWDQPSLEPYGPQEIRFKCSGALIEEKTKANKKKRKRANA